MLHLEYVCNPRGVMIGTVGSGGFSIHELEGASRFVADQYLGYGILDLSFINNQTSAIMNGTFYSNDGQIQDNFSILKPSIHALIN